MRAPRQARGRWPKRPSALARPGRGYRCRPGAEWWSATADLLLRVAQYPTGNGPQYKTAETVPQNPAHDTRSCFSATAVGEPSVRSSSQGVPARSLVLCRADQADAGDRADSDPDYTLLREEPRKADGPEQSSGPSELIWVALASRRPGVAP